MRITQQGLRGRGGGVRTIACASPAALPRHPHVLDGQPRHEADTNAIPAPWAVHRSSKLGPYPQGAGVRAPDAGRRRRGVLRDGSLNLHLRSERKARQSRRGCQMSTIVAVRQVKCGIADIHADLLCIKLVHVPDLRGGHAGGSGI